MFSNQDPHPRQVHLEGTNSVLATITTKVSHVPEPPAPMHTSATSQGVDGITLGSSASPPLNRQGNHPLGLGSPTPSSIVPATVTSSFGGVVTPVNVLNLHQALIYHPNRKFVEKLCLELREGAKIGYSGPRCSRFSKNLPTAFLNPEVVTSNLAEEVAKGRTAGPFRSPPRLRIFKSHQLALSLRSIPTSLEQYSICPSLNPGPLVLTILLKRMTSHFNTLPSTMPLQLSTVLVPTALWPKLT